MLFRSRRRQREHSVLVEEKELLPDADEAGAGESPLLPCDRARADVGGGDERGAEVPARRVHPIAKADVLGTQAWTVPTVVGTRVYLRDRAVIKALDIG